MNLLETAKKIIEKYNMISLEDRIVVGVSGGPDSIVLLHILWRLKDEFNISLTAAHLNHGLRGKDAVDDEEFVKEFSRKLGIPIKSENVKVYDFAKTNNLTVEDAGRKLRYDFFKRVAEETNSNKVALGHNLDDNSETVLMRIIRGTGVDGIAGIPPVRDLTDRIKIIRPLIETKREEIVLHLKTSKLESRVDKTNFARTYFRNRIRLELLPIIEKKYNRNIKENLVNISKIFSAENDFFSSKLSEVLPQVIKEKSEDKIVIYREKLAELHIAIKRRIIRECIKMLQGGMANVAFEHIDDIINAFNKGNLEFELPNKVKVLFRYDTITITAVKDVKEIKKIEPTDYKHEIIIPGETQIKEAGITINAEFMEKVDFGLIRRDSSKSYFDCDMLVFPLFARNRKDGDKFMPFGFYGTKKVKNYFIDKKVVSESRDKIPIISDSKDNIVWIVGHRTDNRFRITDKTNKILKLEVKQKI